MNNQSDVRQRIEDVPRGRVSPRLALGQAELPQRIEDVQHLEQLLSEPTEAAIAALAKVAGDVIILGVGGKMGPSLAHMLVRGSQAAGLQPG